MDKEDLQKAGGYVIGILLFLAVMAAAIGIGGDKNNPDYSGDGAYDPCLTGGHPLWQDC